jgi:hypothetical protein
MFKQLFFPLVVIAGMSTLAVPVIASATSIDLLSSTNATWTADAGIPANATCTLLPRTSGDSISADWTMKTGLWSNTWISILGKPLVSLTSADTFKVLYTNNNADGFSLRLTIIANFDTSMWQSAYLNGVSGLQAAVLPLNSTVFPIQFAKTGSTFRLDSLKSISFINNTNPTTIASGTTITGKYTITQLLATVGSAAVKPSTMVDSHTGSIQISSTGFFAPKEGGYAVSIYKVNGTLARISNGNYKIGINTIDFSKIGPGVFIIKVSGNGFEGSSRLILNK